MLSNPLPQAAATLEFEGWSTCSRKAACIAGECTHGHLVAELGPTTRGQDGKYKNAVLTMFSAKGTAKSFVQGSKKEEGTMLKGVSRWNSLKPSALAWRGRTYKWSKRNMIHNFLAHLPLYWKHYSFLFLVMPMLCMHYFMNVCYAKSFDVY